MRTHLLYICLPITACIANLTSFAQKEPAKKQSIDIISSYKPFLRNPVKINLTATNLNADTSRPVLKYLIPAQNLFYTYSPTPIKPLALEHDTVLNLGTRNFIKAGAGNYATPYINAGFSFGDGKKELINLYGDYTSSTGRIKYQDYAHANITATGSFFNKSNEYYGLVEMNRDNYDLYGYDHVIHNYTEDSVSRYYQTIRLKAGLRNIIPGGFDYDPTIDVKIFTSQHNLVENTAIVNAPVVKKLTDDVSLKLTGVANVTSYSVDSSATVKASFNNNIFQIAPEVIVEKEYYIAHIGLTPSWDNTTLNVLPNIYGEVHLRKQLFAIQAGVVGTIIKNSFSNLSAINPYIQTITSTQNTKEVEIYGGLKSSISKHFSASGKVSIITYNNLPLFINDSLDGKTFYISNEAKLNDFRLHFDMSYISQDKFTLTSGVTLHQYAGLQKNAQAWGYIPVELNASVRWEAFKDVVFKGSLDAFNGAHFLLKNNIDKTQSGGADLSIGTEVKITKRISAWLDLNNLFNDKYQRWNNYEVYGLNVLGGIVYRW